MKKLVFAFFLMALTASFGASGISAQEMKDNKTMKSDGNPMVGGAAMYKNKNIVENAVNSKDHTTLVAASKPPDWSKRCRATDRSRFSLP
jgi:uncharacterized surface protein with fasciclin (FAS1) repeats